MSDPILESMRKKQREKKEREADMLKSYQESHQIEEKRKSRGFRHLTQAVDAEDALSTEFNRNSEARQVEIQHAIEVKHARDDADRIRKADNARRLQVQKEKAAEKARIEQEFTRKAVEEKRHRDLEKRRTESKAELVRIRKEADDEQQRFLQEQAAIVAARRQKNQNKKNQLKFDQDAALMAVLLQEKVSLAPELEIETVPTTLQDRLAMFTPKAQPQIDIRRRSMVQS